MTPTLHAVPLATLSRQLRTHVRADLRGVRLAIATDLPCAAFAFGDLVVVSAAMLRRAPHELLAVVVHELVHVFQQRAGRTDTHGTSVVLDPCLEAEAEAAAARVTRGDRVRLSAPCSRRPRPVLQPKLIVDGVEIASLSALNAKVLRLSALVPQATVWLEWAAAQTAPTFEFADERALLSGLEQGLQGSLPQQLPTLELTCDLAALLALDDADLDQLLAATQDGRLSSAASAALNRAGIYTAADFARADAMAATYALDLPGASASLAARCAWQAIVDNSTSLLLEVAQAADDFARPRSHNLFAYAAAWEGYFALAPSFRDLPTLNAAWDALAPFAMPLLCCPVLSPALSDAKLLEEIQQLAAHDVAGFATLNHALANLVAHARLSSTPPLDPLAISQAIATYLQSARSIVQSGAATLRHLQDGSTRWITYDNPLGRAVYQFDALGHLTLLKLQPA